MRRIEVAELSLATLDALDVDALALLVGEERPLQGLAGLVDWRLAGALTRTLLDGLYAAGPGEALLLPTAGRRGKTFLPYQRGGRSIPISRPPFLLDTSPRRDGREEVSRLLETQA